MLIVGYAAIRGHYGAGAYVGLIAQDPMRTWHGLTGFFISWCPGCDAEGNRTMKNFAAELRGPAITLKSIWDLTPAIHPEEGWFDRDRLQFGGYVNCWPGVSELWSGRKPGGSQGSSLVATGPVITSLANVVLVDELGRDERALAALRPKAPLWSFRQGERGVLTKLAAIPSERVVPERRNIRRRADIPAAWGTYRSAESSSDSKPVTNLRRTLHTHRFAGPARGASPVMITYLPPGQAAKLSDILKLW